MSWQDYCMLKAGGEMVARGNWFMSSEEDPKDPETLVWYTSKNGAQIGTQLGACKIIDSVYGAID